MTFKPSLRAILGKNYNSFVADFIYKPLEQLVKEGQIEPHTLAKIAQHVKRHGSRIFDVSAEQLDQITKNTIDEGHLITARIPLPGDIDIVNFVKIFSDRNSYRKSLEIQRKLYDHFEGTDLEGVVPEPIYGNKKQNILLMPFINGSTLNEMLENGNREDVLKGTVDVYVDATKAAKEIFYPNTVPKIADRAQTFDERFAKGDEELNAVFREYLAGHLQKNDEFMHGDFHPGNVIHNEKIHLIDWEHAMWGFAEYDLYKLLVKSGVDNALERRIVEHAAEKRGVDKQESWKRYRFNQVYQDLLTADRYLKRSKGNDKLKEKLENMANASYNLALRHAELAETEGLLNPRFRQVLESRVQKPLHRVKDFESLMKDYNPHTMLSHQHLAIPSLDAIADEECYEDVQKHLKAIKKGLYRRNWGRIGKMAAVLLFGVSALTLAGYSAITANLEKNRVEQEQFANWDEDAFCGYFKQGYRTLESSILLNKAVYPLQNYPFNGVNFMNGSEIQPVCDKYGVDPKLVKTIMLTNNVYALDRVSMFEKTPPHGMALMDPAYCHVADKPVDPKENLEFGVKRLKGLLDKHNGDLKKALFEFYGSERSEKRGWGERYDPKKCLQQLKNIVYTVLEGGPDSQHLGSDWLLYIKTAPNDFKP